MKTTTKAPNYQSMRESQRDMDPIELEVELIRIGKVVAKNVISKGYKGIPLDDIESEVFMAIAQKTEYLKNLIKEGKGAMVTSYLTRITTRSHCNLITESTIEKGVLISIDNLDYIEEESIQSIESTNKNFLTPWIIKDGLNNKRKYIIDFLKSIATSKQLEALEFYISKGDKEPLSPVFTNRLSKLQTKASGMSAINKEENHYS